MNECTLLGSPRESTQKYDFQFGSVENVLYANGNRDVDDVKTWFPCDDRCVFYRGTDPPLTYYELHNQVQSAPIWQGTNVVAVLLRPLQMAEMAVVLVSLLVRPNICVAPLDPSLPRPKLMHALDQLNCTSLVSTRDLLQEYQLWADTDTEWKDFKEKERALQNLRSIYIVNPCPTKGAGAVDWISLYVAPPNHHDDDSRSHDLQSSPKPPALLLRTSGTTAEPKVVPINRAALLYNAVCLATSLKLERDDIGCNAMPLFHIGGISCALLAVLVSGSAVIMLGLFDPNAFLDCLLAESEVPNDAGYQYGKLRLAPSPTWYYGVPTMHKSLLLTGTARLQRLRQLQPNTEFLVTRLRFIRSGADHLPHRTAVELSNLFHVPVLPTYSMSECMPVCSSNLDEAIVWDKPTTFMDSVGFPIGCSLKIINKEEETLGYDGGVGEVAISGPGVISAYRGIPPSTTHTSDGWLKTGDIGILDREGGLILKGRLKHVIKRGGEQVWPDEVDDIIKEVAGVETALTFGVPNELWGEEVAAAVVLTTEGLQRGEPQIKEDILERCKESLVPASVPCQIVFLDSTERLLKNSTGKYIRAGLADHLGVTSQDVRAQLAMNAVAATAMHPRATKTEPSTALNGLRLLVACFVVQTHIGLYPNTAWIRIQNFSLNMQIFFFLGAFQLVCSVGGGVLNTWAHFVGTKIGSMHAVFVISQIIALPSYLMFQCGPNGWQEKYNGMSCTEAGKWWRTLVGWIINTACGIFDNEVNSASWFLAAFYMLIFLFPWMDSRLRKSTRGMQFLVLVLSMVISVFAFRFLYMKAGLWILSFKIVAWLPCFVGAMIAGYFFLRSGSIWGSQQEECLRPATFLSGFLWRLTRPDIVTDSLSVVCLMMEVTMAVGKDCVWMPLPQFHDMRPGEPIPPETFLEVHSDWNETYVKACNITMDEYTEHVYLQSDSSVLGRWSTNLDYFAGFIVLHFPLVWMWLYAMAHGRGLTVYVLNNRFLQKLDYLAYPLFLLHMPVSRFYWVATRGHDAEKWWYLEETSPIPGDWYYEEYVEMPVAWYETLIIIFICLVLGAAIDRFIIPHLMPYTMRLGVYVCKRLTVCGRGCCNRYDGETGEEDISTPVPSTIGEQVEAMVKGLTGHEVTRDTSLRGIGLDSLGATALLSILKASVDGASKLTMQDIATFQTAGDLIDFLEVTKDGEENNINNLENV